MSYRKLTVEERIALTKFEVHREPHIKIDIEKCRLCSMKPCVHSCPAGLYQIDEAGNIKFSYEGCLECGTCRIVCPLNAVRWDYPPSGFGVIYRFG